MIHSQFEYESNKRSFAIKFIIISNFNFSPLTVQDKNFTAFYKFIQFMFVFTSNFIIYYTSEYYNVEMIRKSIRFEECLSILKGTDHLFEPSVKYLSIHKLIIPQRPTYNIKASFHFCILLKEKKLTSASFQSFVVMK